MTHLEMILSGLSLAFVFIEALRVPQRIKLLNIKPFNCMMCLTGWMTSGVAAINGYSIPALVLFLAAGVFAGAMFEALRMRYL